MIKEAARDIGDPELDQIDGVITELRQNFLDNRTKDLAFRMSMLKCMLRGVDQMESEFAAALHQDLGSDEATAYMSNTLLFKNDLKEAISNLGKWASPKPAGTPLGAFPGKALIKPQPRGIVLVLGSWNFPISTIIPFVSAIAAGNVVIIKPSEFAPAVSHVFKKFFEKYLDRRYYRCIEGAVKTAIKLTNTPFDMICFTGSTFTGKLIAKAASEHLTPLVLELGGKCPTVVDRAANIQLAARRIVSGKFTNCGQVCIAPDYIFAHREILNQLIQEIKNQIELQFGKKPKENAGYSRLIHEAHVKRTESLLKGHEEKIIAKYGEIDAKDRFFPPTLLLEPDINSTLMKEEIFGPILPIYPYDSPMDVIKFINSGSRPLTVYYYGQPDSIVRQRLEENTTSGSFVVNECIIHFAISTLPFGGIGDSGYGTTHGEHGFNQFCNMRAVFERPNSTFLDVPFRYAGMDSAKRLKMLKKVEFAFLLTFEEVMSWFKLLLFVGLVFSGLWLGVKYRLVAFPAFGIGN